MEEQPQPDPQEVVRHRLTEQGDELTETHSIAQRENRAKNPYRPPRQPSQDPPGEAPAEERGLQRRGGAF